MLGIRNGDYVAGYIGRIPVRNIWLLMLYASALYRELPESRSVAVEAAPDDIPNLAAEILTRAIARRMRRNLSHDYQRRYADLPRVRGRINLLRTERRQLLQRGRVACIYDELTVDTPQNRFVKAALQRLSRIAPDPDLARSCGAWAATMARAGVADPLHPLGRPEPPSLRATRVDASDRQMLAAAQLAFDLAIPTEEAGASRLAMPVKEERWARKLFERAIAGFYDATLSRQGWRVHYHSWIEWPLEQSTPGLDTILPSMQTDVVLERRNATPNRRIVIDTKFTSIVYGGHYRAQSLKSGHIYQLYAYLRSQEHSGDPLSGNATGILLYPAIEAHIDEAAVIQGHEIRFATVDLAAAGSDIRRRLLDIALRSPLDEARPA